jgi:hypothetical protein
VMSMIFDGHLPSFEPILLLHFARSSVKQEALRSIFSQTGVPCTPVSIVFLVFRETHYCLLWIMIY